MTATEEKTIKSYGITLVGGSHHALAAADYREDDNWIVFIDEDGLEVLSIVKAYVVMVETKHDGGDVARLILEGPSGPGAELAGYHHAPPPWQDGTGLNG